MKKILKVFIVIVFLSVVGIGRDTIKTYASENFITIDEGSLYTTGVTRDLTVSFSKKC